MKKSFLFLVSATLFICFFSCKQEDMTYDAKVQIDSLHQDSVLFGTHMIPENLHIYYSVINNDYVDIHNYSFTVKATTIDSYTYSAVENSNGGVKGNTVKNGQMIMGIGAKAYLGATVENYTFE